MWGLGSVKNISTSERLHIYRIMHALYGVGAYFCRDSKTKIVTTHLADNNNEEHYFFSLLSMNFIGLRLIAG